MKLLKLASLYPSYIERWRKALPPDARSLTYQQLLELLMEDCFAWADFWSLAFRIKGWECRDVLIGVHELDQAWIRENGTQNTQLSSFEVAVQQVKAFEPQLIFIDDFALLTPEQIDRLRVEAPQAKLISWCGAPYAQHLESLRRVDGVLSNIPRVIESLQADGHTAAHVHHAFSSVAFERVKKWSIARGPAPVIPFSFFGQIVRGRNQHGRRERLIKRLVKESPLEIHCSMAEISLLKSMFKHGIKTVLHPFTHLLGVNQDKPVFPIDFELRPRLRLPAYGREFLDALGRSQLTLNSHIDLSRDFASNMRLFEATGMGACVLTENQSNLKELFEPDLEVVTYDSDEECLEKALYLIRHPTECSKIGIAAQRRVMREHQFENRLDAFERFAIGLMHKS
jgi:spore maturation protein CgeB